MHDDRTRNIACLKERMVMIPPSSILSSSKNAQWMWDVISKSSNKESIEQAIVDLNNDFFEGECYTNNDKVMQAIHTLLWQKISDIGCDDLTDMIRKQVGKN